VPGVLLEGVSRRFGAVAAVDDFSLAVEPGEFVTLLGPSGCGKTTTLRMVAGLEQNDTGRISIGDRVVSDAGAGLFLSPDRRQIGMVFQSYAIWPHMTVFDNVAYPLRIRRRSAGEIEEKVGRALRLVEMERFAQRPAPALSGGQQQRVAIARALVFEPEVLLLDEPLSNLDAKLRTQMGDEFRSLQRRLRLTTLYVTHDQEEAMALSDRVVVMQAGRILQTGKPEDIYHRPASRAVAAFFGAPNFLACRVTACRPVEGGRYRLDVKGEGWRGECLAAESFTAGDGALMVVRPENIALGEAAKANGQAWWPGRIVDSIFRGARRSLIVEAEGRRFNVEAPALQPVNVGESVTLIARADSAWALRP
jgi:iron(III) transport system ATP-binding protein